MTIALSTKRDIAHAYAQGAPTKIIAHEFGVARSYVTNIATSQGVPSRLNGRPAAPRHVNDDEVSRLFKSGLDTDSIAARLCIRPHEAANALARARDRARA
jgi:DNA-binding CsgD family transcriptional regulator